MAYNGNETGRPGSKFKGDETYAHAHFLPLSAFWERKQVLATNSRLSGTVTCSFAFQKKESPQMTMTVLRECISTKVPTKASCPTSLVEVSEIPYSGKFGGH